MKITCVTSMNKPYYENIGQLMLESWNKRWFEDSNLVVYEENFSTPNLKNVIKKDWNLCCEEDWTNFCKKTELFPVKKFAKKGFAFLHAMKNIDCDLLIWLDADLLFYKNIDKSKIQKLLPEHKLIAFFDQYYKQNPNYTEKEYLDPSRPITAAESGFVIVNKTHHNFPKYVENYQNLYSRSEQPNNLGNWYDNNVLTGAAFEFASEVEDLSKLRTTNKTQTPLNRSWLAEYFNHQKGDIKDRININEKRKQLGL